MDLDQHIDQRITECATENQRYIQWLGKLRAPNLLLVGLGSLLSFLGGAAILANAGEIGKTVAGIMALVGGALTGLHSWLGCESHQSECSALARQHDSLKTRYETLLIEPDQSTKLNRLRELEAELAKVKEGRKVVPWQSFWKFWQ